MLNDSKNSFNVPENFVNEVRTNTKSDLIQITEDKLENILLKYLNTINKSNGWVTPVSLFFTFFVVILSVDFKDFLSLTKDTWKAIFIILMILSFIWTIKSVYIAISCSKKSTIEHLINLIKNNQN